MAVNWDLIKVGWEPKAKRDRIGEAIGVAGRTFQKGREYYRKKQEEENIKNIMQSSIDPTTGKLNAASAAEQFLQQGDLGKAADLSKFAEIQQKQAAARQNQLQKENELLVQQQQKDFDAYARATRSQNPNAAIDYAKKNLGKYFPGVEMTSPDMKIKPEIHEQIMGKLSQPVYKNQMEFQNKKRLKALDEEFATQYLPSVDVSTFTTDPEAKNKFIHATGQTKFRDAPAYHQFLKDTKGKGSNIIEQMAKIMGASNVKDLSLTGEEQKGLGSLEPAIKDMNTLVDLYKTGDTGTAGSSMAKYMAKVPFVGQRLFPDAKGFQKHKVIMAERFLRAATGAAAPDAEVATYQGFLPKWDDTPLQAQNAIKTFMGNVEAKARESVSRLRTIGTPESLEKATRIEQNIKKALMGIKKIEQVKTPPIPSRPDKGFIWKNEKGQTYEFLGGNPKDKNNWRLK